MYVSQFKESKSKPYSIQIISKYGQASYRDFNDRETAIQWAKKRSTSGTWVEELTLIDNSKKYPDKDWHIILYDGLRDEWYGI